MEIGRFLGYFLPVFGAMTSEKSGNTVLESVQVSPVAEGKSREISAVLQQVIILFPLTTVFNTQINNNNNNRKGIRPIKIPIRSISINFKSSLITGWLVFLYSAH